NAPDAEVYVVVGSDIRGVPRSDEVDQSPRVCRILGVGDTAGIIEIGEPSAQATDPARSIGRGRIVAGLDAIDRVSIENIVGMLATRILKRPLFRLRDSKL